MIDLHPQGMTIVEWFVEIRKRKLAMRAVRKTIRQKKTELRLAAFKPSRPSWFKAGFRRIFSTRAK